MSYWGLANRPALGPLATLALCSLSPGAVLAEEGRDEAQEIRDALATIQTKDQRLQDIGWRLAAGNAGFCNDRRLAVGLQLLDLASFRNPDPIRVAFSAQGDFMVQTIAKGSPAQLAELPTYSEITAINGEQLNRLPSGGDRDWQRLKSAHDAIDLALDETGEVRITRGDGQGVSIAGTAICSTRFELNDRGKRAVADGARVQIGAHFPAFDYPEDELAAAIAHELAHNILEHRAWLNEVGRERKHVRATEREADRLMPWLLANAGYEPEAALRFMQKWGPRHSGGIFRKRTHDGWDERAKMIATEIEGMRQLWDGNGPADWRKHFVREIAED